MKSTNIREIAIQANTKKEFEEILNKILKDFYKDAVICPNKTETIIGKITIELRVMSKLGQ